MELSIICANFPVLSTWIDDLVSGHNGFHVTARDTGFELTDVSRRTRTVKSKERSHNRASNAPTSTLGRPPADAGSDHGSQTRILKTTAFQVDHDGTGMAPSLDRRSAQTEHHWDGTNV